jgi:hypothetical protein
LDRPRDRDSKGKNNFRGLESSNMKRWRTLGIALLAAGACGDKGGETGEGEETSGGIDVSATDTDMTTGEPKLDVGGGSNSTSGPMGCGAGDSNDCSGFLDLLFVIDNSGSMGEEQRNLALNMPLLVQQLENLTDVDGDPIDLDVHIMVTTTDSGNPLCDPFYHPGREPEMGRPISSACTSRLARFTGLGNMPPEFEAACTDVCPEPVAPNGQYIQFNDAGDNVPDVPPADINGDGTDDSALAQALACVGPQGIDGCGYEKPLDSMMRALDPGANWNDADGFLRGGGLLGVVVITDEADCSIVDESVMMDAMYQNTHPDTMEQQASSAICWNAGVTCDGPNQNGVYSNCTSGGAGLTPVDEYIDFLEGLGRPVVMLGILGVPEVTEHAMEAPFQPTAGGVLDLQYRQWRDPDWDNGGDILPDEWAEGITAAYQQFQYGIGPGCTGEDGSGGFTGQAIPPVRVKEVCESLNVADDPGTPQDETSVRCCIESICDQDFSDAIRCLGGLVETNFVPES